MNPVIHLLVIGHIEFFEYFRVHHGSSLCAKVCPAEEKYINFRAKSIPVFLEAFNCYICTFFKNLMYIFRIQQRSCVPFCNIADTLGVFQVGTRNVVGIAQTKVSRCHLDGAAESLHFFQNLFVIGDLLIGNQRIVFHIVIRIRFIFIKFRGTCQIVKVKSVCRHVAAGRAGVIPFRIYIESAFSVIFYHCVAGNQHGFSAVCPLFPCISGMPICISIVIQLLYVTSHTVCQIRLYISSHRRHIVDFGQALFQTIIVSQLLYHQCIHHGTAHTAEIYRNFIWLCMGKSRLYSFF